VLPDLVNCGHVHGVVEPVAAPAQPVDLARTGDTSIGAVLLQGGRSGPGRELRNVADATDDSGSNERAHPGQLVRLMPHQRGVLRQAGAVYQFRYIRLQHRLVNRDANEQQTSSSAAPPEPNG
jgi:hypothetical protein